MQPRKGQFDLSVTRP
nr:unnamed protein product [Callosobruchus chinensis]